MNYPLKEIHSYAGENHNFTYHLNLIDETLFHVKAEKHRGRNKIHQPCTLVQLNKSNTKQILLDH
jgi:hypothetical protein